MKQIFDGKTSYNKMAIFTVLFAALLVTALAWNPAMESKYQLIYLRPTKLGWHLRLASFKSHKN